jgi:ribonuclease-3
MAIETGRKHPEAGLAALEESLNYTFRDRSLLELALTHSSVAYEQNRGGAPSSSNERLEFLGDAVLSLAVTEYIFHRFDSLNEGGLTRLRARIVGRENLHRAAQSISLGEFLRLGKGEERSGGRRKSALLADALEALIAAVYLDGGIAPAAATVRHLFLGPETGRLAEDVARGATGDFKTRLQEYLQKRGLGHPEYSTVSQEGPPHDRRFVVEVSAHDASGGRRPLATGEGGRKKSAEQQAAHRALAVLDTDSGGHGASA